MQTIWRVRYGLRDGNGQHMTRVQWAASEKDAERHRKDLTVRGALNAEVKPIELSVSQKGVVAFLNQWCQGG